MLLDAVVIMLRETLEAGVLISLLLSLSRDKSISFYWLVYSILMGGVCALIYAMNLNSVSQWFDFVGQEVVNAFSQYIIYICLLFSILLFYGQGKNKVIFKTLFTLIVILAIMREGFEIFIFFSSYLHDETLLAEVLTSGFIGVMIGISVGILCFYLITSIKSASIRQTTQLVFLIFIAAGMVSQATRLLVQADWLPSSLAVWDSNFLVAEQSIVGQILYAIFGYEASPTGIEVWFYSSSITLILIGLFFITLIQRLTNQSRNMNANA